MSSSEQNRPSNDGERWGQLMRAAQDGDKAAYRHLLIELLPFLRGFVGRRWRSPQDVEDIVQEVLLSLHTVRHTFEPNRPFLPWLVTIASRRIADAARGASRRGAHETLVDEPPETFDLAEANIELSSAEISDDVRLAMSSLTDAQRQAVQMTKLQGLSLEEASLKSGRSVASLKALMHRSLIAMRNVLRDKA